MVDGCYRITTSRVDRDIFHALTTIISHRKNLMEKLGIKSVSGLTIYAVTNGIIRAEDI